MVWQVTVSAPILILIAPLFGPLIRDLQPIHLWALAFQTVVLVSFGFIFWLLVLFYLPRAQISTDRATGLQRLLRALAVCGAGQG